MSQTFVPGYQTTVTLASDDFTVYGNVLSMSLSKTTPRKPTFGSQASQVISGQQAWSMSASGHIAAEGPVSELIAAADAEAPIAYTIQIGEALGATDVGSFAGTCVISSLEMSADADGEWDWSMSAEISGPNPFTPAV